MQNVYIFGDKIENGDVNDRFISYNIEGSNGGFLFGPFGITDDITSDYNDILTYEGVFDVKILNRSELA